VLSHIPGNDDTETHRAKAVEALAAAVHFTGAVASEEGLALCPEGLLILREELAKL